MKTFAQAFEAFLVYELKADRVGVTYDVFKNKPQWRPKYGDVSEWRPTYGRGEDGKIRAYNNQTAVWWGHKDGDKIVPLFLREVSESIDAAYLEANPDADPKTDLTPKNRNAFLDSMELAVDDNGDGKREINTETEIANFSKMLAKQLAGKRFEKLNPVLVSGSKVHEVDESGNIKSYEHPQAKPVLWSVSHNVAPRDLALGADGNCEECHSPDSYFFYGKALVDPYDMTKDAKPVKAAMINMMGYPDSGPDQAPVVVRTSQFFKWLTITVMALLILHILADLIRRALRKGSK